ncbi:MAG TPA: ATP-binding protein, partial [Baekduia sp.]|nr:ATP-binding protein [Baekduia sp.]
TVNAMVDQLNRFASEVTRVAREVGVEGKLGGQAQSAEVAGVWKDLTDNVNQLAANLTNQVRAIADVATAVTEGDLTRQVGVEASGEVAVLKDKLNEMIRNLRETTRQNTEQDWLKTNLERFTRMLQGQRDLATVSSMILSELAPLVSAQHGVLYTLSSLEDGEEPVLRYEAGYGHRERPDVPDHYRLGEGLVGQCAKERRRILLTDVPGDYIRIHSGLGERAPLNIIVLPILFEGSVRAVVELASFSRFSPTHQAFLEQLTESIGLVLNTIEANTLTENLLEESQSQARYKSEFFSTMSHELRTPLNSLLILARELEDNPDHNLSEAQVQHASVIHSSGTDLLRLLNAILDLAKVESGTVALKISELPLVDLQEALERDYRHVAEHKALGFSVELAPNLAPTIATDADRLRQVLKNLLSNAFKFTEHGRVGVRISQADGGWSPANATLGTAGAVTAFAIDDTGIGITTEMQRPIFEAFAQADGTTARQYGGTGLGLSISRELVRLLGGEITLTSTPDQGSTFTVYLPSTTSGDAGEGAAAPAAAVRASRPLSSPERRSGAALAGMKALVIDDDVRNIIALTTLLERGHLQVVSAESGAEGVAILERTPDIDVAVVDMMMPLMDGYATMRAMRQLPRGADLPIVALTASVAAGERQRCLDAGASAYVSKPVDSAELLLVLGDWLLAASPAVRAGEGLAR